MKKLISFVLLIVLPVHLCGMLTVFANSATSRVRPAPATINTLVTQQELPIDVSTTIGDLKRYRDDTESLARIFAKAFKDYKDDQILKQAKDSDRATIQLRIEQYRRAAQLYGSARAAFGGWAEMIRDALATKGKGGAERELNRNPVYRERSKQAIAAANAFVQHAENMLYPQSRDPKFQWPTFDVLSNLGKEIIKGIFAWKKYKEQKRKDYANEFYKRIEWQTTWDQIESGSVPSTAPSLTPSPTPSPTKP